jgi:hypothetical protein
VSYEQLIAKAAQEQLVGRKIVNVMYMDNESSEEMGWDGRRGVVIELDDGTQLFPMQDDEGNGPGALATSLEGVLGTIGVIS